ncbi:hypothetical protein MMC08_003642 [Hypocenomyce scalaris]|nr:hypothetical protein [Hypocenomyce scalaris]
MSNARGAGDVGRKLPASKTPPFAKLPAETLQIILGLALEGSFLAVSESGNVHGDRPGILTNSTIRNLKETSKPIAKNIDEIIIYRSCTLSFDRPDTVIRFFEQHERRNTVRSVELCVFHDLNNFPAQRHIWPPTDGVQWCKFLANWQVACSILPSRVEHVTINTWHMPHFGVSSRLGIMGSLDTAKAMTSFLSQSCLNVQHIELRAGLWEQLWWGKTLSRSHVERSNTITVEHYEFQAWTKDRALMSGLRASVKAGPATHHPLYKETSRSIAKVFSRRDHRCFRCGLNKIFNDVTNAPHTWCHGDRIFNAWGYCLNKEELRRAIQAQNDLVPEGEAVPIVPISPLYAEPYEAFTIASVACTRGGRACSERRAALKEAMDAECEILSCLRIMSDEGEQEEKELDQLRECAAFVRLARLRL